MLLAFTKSHGEYVIKQRCKNPKNAHFVIHFELD